MTEIWNAAIVGPLEGGLIYLYGVLGSYGLAIIVLTLAIKLLLFPLTLQQIKSSQAMKGVQPLLEDVKRRYGKDKERLTQETMRIYRENGVNPVAGCLPLLIQMPIWFGLYWALINLQGSQDFASEGFLWLPSLGAPDPFYILVALTVVTQFVVQKMMVMPSTDPQQQTMNKVMMFMPLTFGFVAMSVPSGLALYWVTTNVFTFFQQLLTTGWGDLQPIASRLFGTPAAPSQPSRPSQPAEDASTSADAGADASANGASAQVAGTRPQARASKAARHKKRAGAKPPREEKRANGKR